MIIWSLQKRSWQFPNGFKRWSGNEIHLNGIYSPMHMAKKSQFEMDLFCHFKVCHIRKKISSGRSKTSTCQQPYTCSLTSEINQPHLSKAATKHSWTPLKPFDAPDALTMFSMIETWNRSMYTKSLFSLQGFPCKPLYFPVRNCSAMLHELLSKAWTTLGQMNKHNWFIFF